VSIRPEPSHAAEPARAESRLGPAGGAARAVALRPATPADDEFCWQLHKAAMGGYIAAIWGWDEQKQRRSQTRSFSPGRWQVITVDGADAGMLDVVREPGQTYLSRIEILPRFQGQGIGTRLIGELIDEAARQGQDFVLEVLTVNERAQALYRRLGLTEVARRGDVKITMRLRPAN
jgi:ribosomal protein S18 acetylase RimI-like enzyme